MPKLLPPLILKPPLKSPTTGPTAVTLVLCVGIGGPEGAGEAVGSGVDEGIELGVELGVELGAELGAELGVGLGEGVDVIGDADVSTDVAVIDVAQDPLPVASAYKPRAGAGPLLCAPDVYTCTWPQLLPPNSVNPPPISAAICPLTVTLAGSEVVLCFLPMGEW